MINTYLSTFTRGLKPIVGRSLRASRGFCSSKEEKPDPKDDPEFDQKVVEEGEREKQTIIDKYQQVARNVERQRAEVRDL